MQDDMEAKFELADWRASDCGVEDLPEDMKAVWATKVVSNRAGVNIDVVDPLAVEGGADRSQSVLVEMDMGCPKIVAGPLGDDALVLIRMAEDKLVIQHFCQNLPALVVDHEGWHFEHLTDEQIEALGAVKVTAPNPAP